MKVTICVLLMTLFAMQAYSQKDVPITPIKVTDDIVMLQGAGGNIGLFIDDDGVIMIDDQFAHMADKITAAIATFTDLPIKYLVNTHWHGDHTGGNEIFAGKGATIVAQENVYKRLSTDQIRPFGRKTEASPEAAWPKLTFSDKMSIHVGKESIQLIHHHNAHTDGDSFVYFPMSNVLHMGDTFFAGRFPYIDLDMGGTPDGLIKAAAAALMICDADTKIIPGHGGLSDKDDLSSYHQMLLIMQSRIEAAISKGTAEDALDVATLTEGYDSWGTGFINGEKFVKTLYRYFSDK